jgi:copper chaperone CopZ
MTCDYCEARATTQIPTIPGRVCETHAREFWIGLLAYARNQRLMLGENHETPSVSEAVSLRLIPGRAAAASSRQDTEREPLRRAS